MSSSYGAHANGAGGYRAAEVPETTRDSYTGRRRRGPEPAAWDQPDWPAYEPEPHGAAADREPYSSRTPYEPEPPRGAPDDREHRDRAPHARETYSRSEPAGRAVERLPVERLPVERRPPAPQEPETRIHNRPAYEQPSPETRIVNRQPVDPQDPRLGGYRAQDYDRPRSDGRRPDQQNHDQQNYDRSEYDRQDYDRQDYGRQNSDRPGYGQPGFDQPSYGQPRYDQPGYDQPRYDQPSYDQPGYEQAGFDRSPSGRNRTAAPRDSREPADVTRSLPARPAAAPPVRVEDVPAAEADSGRHAVPRKRGRRRATDRDAPEPVVADEPTSRRTMSTGRRTAERASDPAADRVSDRVSERTGRTSEELTTGRTTGRTTERATTRSAIPEQRSAPAPAPAARRPATASRREAVAAADTTTVFGPAVQPAARIVDAALRTTDVTKVHGQGARSVVALDEVTMGVERGRFTAIMGASGSGKSTLLHCLAGLDKPTTGQVLLGTTDLTRVPERKLTRLRRDRIGFVFQSYDLLPQLTVRQNIVLPLEVAGAKLDQSWFDTVLEALELGGLLRQLPSQLSGGEQQRVAVARAVLTRPDVVLADEPTGALDAGTTREMVGFLRASVDHLGQTVVMVTHDPLAAQHTDRALMLHEGCLVGEVSQPSPHAVLDALAALADAPAGTAAEDRRAAQPARRADRRGTSRWPSLRRRAARQA